jgi:hypothetical protein
MGIVQAKRCCVHGLAVRRRASFASRAVIGSFEKPRLRRPMRIDGRSELLRAVVL